MPFINSLRGTFSALRNTAGGGAVVDVAPLISGGTTTIPGNGFRHHLFTSPGTLSIGGAVPAALSFQYLIVAGGGGGGADQGDAGAGGGGGAGGFKQSSITGLNSPQGITVGNGGAGAPSNAGGSGID